MCGIKANKVDRKHVSGYYLLKTIMSIKLYFTSEIWDDHEKCGGTKQFRLEQDTGPNLGRQKHETHTVFQNSVSTSQLNIRIIRCMSKMQSS